MADKTVVQLLSPLEAVATEMVSVPEEASMVHSLAARIKS